MQGAAAGKDASQGYSIEERAGLQVKIVLQIEHRLALERPRISTAPCVGVPLAPAGSRCAGGQDRATTFPGHAIVMPSRIYLTNEGF